MLTVDKISKSIDYFGRAIEMDPGYALAFAGLAYAYLVLSFYSPTPPRDLYPKAKQAALQALELDDDLAEAHEALGVVNCLWEWDWHRIRREMRRASELNPGYIWAYFHLANNDLIQGRYKKAVKMSRYILAIDPLNSAFSRNLGECYLRAGRLEEAEETLRNTLELDPLLPFTSILLGFVLLKRSRPEEALEAVGKETLKGSVLELNLGIVYARMGKPEEARRILTDWLARSRNEHVVPYTMALLHFALDDKDSGFEWLEKGFQEHDGWLMGIKVDYLLEHVRDDPRF